MFDHLDQRGGIEALDPAITISERPLSERDPRAFLVAQSVQAQTAGGDFEILDADIDAQDVGELPFGHQSLQKLAAPATEVDHRAMRGSW